MAEAKIFAGPRIRRIRNGLKLTQAAMAEALGISPSYLNLIERNQRPLTVQIILRLARTYDIDLAGLQASGEKATTLGDLRVVFADPILAGELPGDGELVEIADAAPNAASAVVKLHRAYRELEGRLSDLSGLMGGQVGGASLARLPNEEVEEAFAGRANHYPGLDAAAEALHAKLGGGDELGSALRLHLGREHEIAVRVLPSDVMPRWRRRYDRHSRRLFLSDRLTAADRLLELAGEVAGLGFAQVIADEVKFFGFASPEARRLATRHLQRYAAFALAMPYAAFQAAAERTRYDLDGLAARFGVSFGHAAERLTSLQRQSAPGPAAFFLEVDQAGNRIRRAGARGFPTQRFGGACVKLPVFEAFGQGGRTLVERAEMPGGEGYLLVARALDGLAATIGDRGRRTAVLVGWPIGQAADIVYGGLVSERVPALPIGPACRICERQGCPARAEALLTRPLGLDESVTGLSLLDFQ